MTEKYYCKFILMRLPWEIDEGAGGAAGYWLGDIFNEQ
jgi:hypothetical protein